MAWHRSPPDAQATTVGHRQRLRDRFLAGEGSSRTEESLLELLLTYAIPQQDVAPLARALLAEFGDLACVLRAEPSRLLKVKGIKENPAVLLKLVDAIQRTLAGETSGELPAPHAATNGQLSLFDALGASAPELPRVANRATQSPERKVKAPNTSRRGTELFTTAFMRDAIEVLPRLPDTDSVEEIRTFVRGSLHYSAEQSR